jgi:hypothetical protein
MGSGTGNDVAAALRHNVDQIDAVEIDPLMVKVGYQLHPEHPYDSPRVRILVNDARAFLQQNATKYDLVMTGLLDSHTVAGTSVSVRLDDYVYTVEGMRSALNHLAPGGLYSISYCAVADYMSKRLTANLRLATNALGVPGPLILCKKGTLIWHFLAPRTEAMNQVLPTLYKDGFQDFSTLDTGGIRPSTDDWPYFYLAPITVDPCYLSIIGCILLLAWAACGHSIRTNNSPKRWHFFLLGAAFLLLELATIDRLALVFGTTWLVNSACIFAILSAIIISNLLIIKAPKIMSPNLMYTCLFVSLTLLYFVPLEKATMLGMWIGGSIAAALSAIPIFFAGLIFSYAFSQEKKPGVGIAFNMFGAVVGGLFEYVATYTGIRSLLLWALAIYGISFALWQYSYRKSTNPLP